MAQVSPELAGGSQECMRWVCSGPAGPMGSRGGHPCGHKGTPEPSFIEQLLRARPYTVPTLSPVKSLISQEVGID